MFGSEPYSSPIYTHRYTDIDFPNPLRREIISLTCVAMHLCRYIEDSTRPPHRPSPIAHTVLTPGTKSTAL